jgi:hypothetical protein
MADVLLCVATSDRQGEFTGLWSGLLSAVHSSAGETQSQAGRLQAAADRDATLLRDQRLDRDTTRKLPSTIARISSCRRWARSTRSCAEAAMWRSPERSRKPPVAFVDVRTAACSPRPRAELPLAPASASGP